MLSKEDHLRIYSAFIDQRYDKWPSESIRHASYNASEKVRQYEWRFFSDLLVSDHLRELSNSLNFWGTRIVDLQAWMTVLPGLDSEKSWAIRSSFVELIASFCIGQPYSLREKYLNSCIQILHQANLATDQSYEDKLPEDIEKRYLTYQEKLNTLKKVGQPWSKYCAFESSLMQFNSSSYTSSVRNFRNLSNHGHAPNFEEGFGISVVRSFGDVTHNIERSDGSVDVINKRCVMYGIGGMPPLTLDAVTEAVVKEFVYAIKTLDCLHDLIEEICSKLKEKKK
jgi:hypothetical protein